MKRGLTSWERDELPEELFSSRVNALREYMRDQDLDTVLVYGDADQAGALEYIPNFFPYADTGIFMLPLHAKPRLFTTHAYRNLPWIKTMTWVEDIICTDHMEKECGEALEALGNIGGRIGLVDTGGFPYPVYDHLQKRLKCEMIDITRDIEAMRAHKDDHEFILMERASEIAQACLSDTADRLKPGISGFDIAAEIEWIARSRGAQDLICRINSDNSPAGLDLPNAEGIRKMCSVEIGVEYKCYWARLGRTFALDSAPAKIHDWIDRVEKIYMRTSGELMTFQTHSDWNRQFSNALKNSTPPGEVLTFIDPGLEPYWTTNLNDRLDRFTKRDGAAFMGSAVIAADSTFFSAADTFFIRNGEASRLTKRS